MTDTFILDAGEKFVQCPYNTSHQITNARVSYHLKKCRDNYKKSLTLEGQKREMRICRFNHTHHVWSPELHYHENHCDDATGAIRYVAYHGSEEGRNQYEELRKQNAETGKPSANAWGLEEEDWEAECSGYGYEAGYDPNQKLQNEVVLVNPKGMTKSERKQYRKDLRETAAERELTGEPTELPFAGSYDVDVNLGMRKLTLADEQSKTKQSASTSNSSGTSASKQRPVVPNSNALSSTNTNSLLSKLKQKPDEDYNSDSDDFEGLDPYEE